jgi:drug/metabolite transporter (DMT)-like permease
LKDYSSVKPSRLLIILAFAAVYIIWGSTYLAIKFAITTLPAFLMAGFRFTLAGSILLIWAFSNGAVRPTLKQWISSFIIGFLLILIGNGGVTWAEQYIDSGVAALLITVEPVWVVLLLWLLQNNRPNFATAFGLVLGIVGMIVLVGPNKLSLIGQQSIFGMGMVILSTIAWASGSIYSMRTKQPASGSLASGMQMLCGGLLLSLSSIFTGEWSVLEVDNISYTSIFALGYLIVFGSIVAFSAYNFLIKNVDPGKVATYAYVNPVIAVFLGWALGGENFSLQTLLAAVLLVAAVVIITTFGHEGK